MAINQNRIYSYDDPLLMIPGPVESDYRTLNQFATRTYAHTEKIFVENFALLLKNLRKILFSSNSCTPVVISGSGTLAMEISLINLIDKFKNQKILICDTGYFANRFQQIAEGYDIPYTTIKGDLGQKISKELLENVLANEQPDFAFIQHVDTSTGVCNDIKMFGEICKKYNTLSVVDSVCSLGGIPIHQTEWDIDVCFSGAQKALAVPPGLSILMYSAKAREVSENRKKKLPSYYADLTNWWPIMDAYLDNKAKYYSTPATNLIVSLAKSTDLILEEGLENRFKRHASNAVYLRNRLEEIGYSFLTAMDSFADTLTTPKYLNKDQGDIFRQKVQDKGVLVAGGLYPGIANTYFRIGHMGICSQKDIEFTLYAFEYAYKF